MKILFLFCDMLRADFFNTYNTKCPSNELDSWFKKIENLSNDTTYFSVQKINQDAKIGGYAQGLSLILNSKKRKEVVRDSLKCKHGCLLSCMFRPSLGEMLTSGPKQFLKLVKSK